MHAIQYELTLLKNQINILNEFLQEIRKQITYFEHGR